MYILTKLLLDLRTAEIKILQGVLQSVVPFRITPHAVSEIWRNKINGKKLVSTQQLGNNSYAALKN